MGRRANGGHSNAGRYRRIGVWGGWGNPLFVGGGGCSSLGVWFLCGDFVRDDIDDVGQRLYRTALVFE